MNIEKIYGTNYVTKSDVPYDLYQYENGVVLKIFPQTGELTFIDVNNKEIHANARILYGNVLSEEGREKRSSVQTMISVPTLIRSNHQ